MLLGITSPKISRMGGKQKIEISSPLFPRAFNKKAVVRAVFVTTHRLVPTRVMARRYSGLCKNFKACSLPFPCMNLGSAETIAISEPEKKPSEEQKQKYQYG